MSLIRSVMSHENYDRIFRKEQKEVKERIAHQTNLNKELDEKFEKGLQEQQD